MSGRTCVKCRLHGKVELLKGHKRNCPYTNCSCGRCTSHVDLLTHKNAVRDQQNDKGRQWRTSLLKSSSPSTTTSTCTSTVQFPEMAVSKGEGENAMLAFQVANYEDSKATVVKTQTKAEQRKAKQLVQLEKHKALYKSINSYSQDVASSSPELSPLMVLKTAIQLHQRDPREVCSSKELPYVQPQIKEHRLQSAKDPAQPLYLDEKLNKLKAVLPMASDVKLASLLVRQKGDMDAVVQHILEEPATEEEAAEPGSEDVADQCSIIDLTGNDSMVEFESTRSSLMAEDLLSNRCNIDVDTKALKTILETVKEREASLPVVNYDNLLSFHRPIQSSSGSMENQKDGQPNEASRYLSRVHCTDKCPHCHVKKTNGTFCNSCGGIFNVNIRW